MKLSFSPQDEAFRESLIPSTTTPPSYSVRAGEVARFVLEQISSDEFVRQGVFVGSK